MKKCISKKVVVFIISDLRNQAQLNIPKEKMSNRRRHALTKCIYYCVREIKIYPFNKKEKGKKRTHMMKCKKESDRYGRYNLLSNHMGA